MADEFRGWATEVAIHSEETRGTASTASTYERIADNGCMQSCNIRSMRNDKKLWGLNASRNIQTSFDGKHDCTVSLEWYEQLGHMFWYGFGKQYGHGCPLGKSRSISSTLNGALSAGATSVKLADGSSFTTDSILRLDTSGKYEFRYIQDDPSVDDTTAVTATHHAHATGATVTEVEGTRLDATLAAAGTTATTALTGANSDISQNDYLLICEEETEGGDYCNTAEVVKVTSDPSASTSWTISAAQYAHAKNDLIIGLDAANNAGTIKTATAVGDTSVTVGSSECANGAAGDYIVVGDGTNAEIRKASAFSSDTYTVTKAFERVHTTSEHVYRLDSTGGWYKFRICENAISSERLPSMTVERHVDASTDQKLTVTGCMCNNIEMVADVDEAAKTTAEFFGYLPEHATTSATTATAITGDPLTWAQSSTLTYNDDDGGATSFSSLKSFTFGINNSLQPKHYLGTSKNYGAMGIGKREYKLSMEYYPAVADPFTIDLLATTRSDYDMIYKLQRDTNDYLLLDVPTCVIDGEIPDIPIEGEVVQTLNFIVEGSPDIEIITTQPDPFCA